VLSHSLHQPDYIRAIAGAGVARQARTAASWPPPQLAALYQRGSLDLWRLLARVGAA